MRLSEEYSAAKDWQPNNRFRKKMNTLSKQEANMGCVLKKFSEHSKIDKDVIETELFAAFRALEVDPNTLTIEELRESLLLYLDEVFYGISPDRVQ
jgi:uncharacterized protein YabN with tetrapyrrole methylase and pyrophosphatase domain